MPEGELDVEKARAGTDIESLKGNSFFRKGETGDWLNHFDAATAAAFEERLKTNGYLDFLRVLSGRGIHVAESQMEGDWAGQLSAHVSATA